MFTNRFFIFFKEKVGKITLSGIPSNMNFSPAFVSFWLTQESEMVFEK